MTTVTAAQHLGVIQRRNRVGPRGGDVTALAIGGRRYMVRTFPFRAATGKATVVATVTRHRRDESVIERLGKCPAAASVARNMTNTAVAAGWRWDVCGAFAGST